MYLWYIASSKRDIWYLYKGRVSYNSQHLKRFQWEPVSTHWAISKPDWWHWAKSMPPQKTNISKGCSNLNCLTSSKKPCAICGQKPLVKVSVPAKAVLESDRDHTLFPTGISKIGLLGSALGWGSGCWFNRVWLFQYSACSANLYQVKIYDYVSYGRKLLIRPRMSKRCFCDGIQTGIAELQGSIQL